jgi:stress response protein YsnF
MSTIIGLYNDLGTAEKVVSALEQKGGVGKDDLHLATYDKRAQERSQGGYFNSLANLFNTKPHQLGNNQDAMTQQLMTWGVSQSDAQNYVQAMQHGDTLVLVHSPADQTDQVKQIMDGYKPSDLDEEATGWQSQAAPGFGTASNAPGAPAARDYQNRQNFQGASDFDTDTENTEETRIPTVEEQMRVGKRQVQHGVRVYTTVSEQPVEETYNVRDEKVNVERHDVDRPATDEDMKRAFQDRDFEVTETDEELVVGKEARVTGEVVVSKDVDEHPQTVRDTVRRTEVHTEDRGTDKTKRNIRDFAQYEPDFRNHFQKNFSNRGYKYDRFAPAYQYGYELAGSNQYQGQQWNAIEPQVRANWERQHPDAQWNDVRDAVHYSWDRATGQTKY